ncbi:MAG: LppX_LprAFG lipoprotein [Chloroflexi bacterium]|nr:LppX_LprAFG lipoprotein [Chloroflexota bacterium]
MQSGLKRLVIHFIALASLLVAACGGAEPSSTAPPGTPTLSPTPVNPRAVLEQAGRAMESVESFAFKLEHQRGGTPLPILPGLLLTEAEGEVVKPDRIAARFNGTIRGSLFVKSSLITLGDASYMTNPVSGAWESVPPDISPLGFFNPSEGVSAMMSQVQSPSLLDSNTPETYRIRGRLPVEALRPLFGETIMGATVGVDLTIDARNLYLTRAEIDGRITEAEEEGVVRVVVLSRFNEPLSIEPPQ